MIDHTQLLQVAQGLAGPRGRGRPKSVYLRRSISSAYYALFHFLVHSATCELVGQDHRSPSFNIVYRSYSHAEMRIACNSAAGVLHPGFGFEMFSQSIQYCATAFVELQKLRHEADYSPGARLTSSDAQGAISLAKAAIARFQSAPEEERRLFLLSLSYKPRS